MNSEQVKELLHRLRPEAPDFKVVFTGKAVKALNGFYRPETREIFLHEKNFSSDAELIYTAVHEFGHHVHFCSEAPPTARTAHNLTFKLIFQDLLTRSMDLGVYAPTEDAEFQKALEEVRSAMKAEAEATKRTGQALMNLVSQSKRVHRSFEDVVERVIGMKPGTAKTAMSAFAQDTPTDRGPDTLKLLVKVRDPETRKELAAMNDLTERKAAVSNVEIPKITEAPERLDPLKAKRARLEAEEQVLIKKLAKVREEIEVLDDQVARIAHRQLVWWRF